MYAHAKKNTGGSGEENGKDGPADAFGFPPDGQAGSAAGKMK